jgi:hypothetical protein
VPGAEWDAMERLPADAGEARHHRRREALGDQLAGPGDAHLDSQPAESFPATSSRHTDVGEGDESMNQFAARMISPRLRL